MKPSVIKPTTFQQVAQYLN